jgi:hypothetical protein
MPETKPLSQTQPLSVPIMTLEEIQETCVELQTSPVPENEKFARLGLLEVVANLVEVLVYEKKIYERDLEDAMVNLEDDDEESDVADVAEEVEIIEGRNHRVHISNLRGWLFKVRDYLIHMGITVPLQTERQEDPLFKRAQTLLFSLEHLATGLSYEQVANYWNHRSMQIIMHPDSAPPQGSIPFPEVEVAQDTSTSSFTSMQEDDEEFDEIAVE